MECLIVSTKSPVTFTIGGKFTTTTPWIAESLVNDDYELLICLSGHLPLKVGHKRVILHPKELLVVPSRVHTSGPEYTNSVSFLWLHFLLNKSATIQNVSQEQLQELLKNKKTGKCYLPFFFKINEIDRILILTYELLNNYWQGMYQFEERNYLMTYLLLALSSDFFQTLKNKSENTNESRILHIKDWIRSHMSENLRLDEISETFGLSNQYVSKLFREHEGMTIIQYINFQKIRVAKTLLLETSLSIKEIAAYAYFKTEKQFFLQFKKLTGTTPLKFRQVHGPIHTNNPSVDPDLPMPKEATLLLRHLKEKLNTNDSTN